MTEHVDQQDAGLTSDHLDAATPDLDDQGDDQAEAGAGSARGRTAGGITSQRIRLNAHAVAVLRHRCPSATLGGSIELAAERLDRLEAEAEQRELLTDYLASHAQAQAIFSGEQAALLTSIAQTLTEGLASQQAAATDLASLVQQILTVVQQLAQPSGQGEDRIAQVLEALGQIAQGIETMSTAVGELAEQISGLGH